MIEGAGIVCLVLASMVGANEPEHSTSPAVSAAHTWAASVFAKPCAAAGSSSERGRRLRVPFSFGYGDARSDEVLDRWEYSSREEPITGGARQTVSYREPATGFVIECQVTTYPDTPAVDWVCYLSNQGPAPTPIIDQFMPLDVTLMEDSAECVLRWSYGDVFLDLPSPEGFLFHDEVLAPGSQPRRFVPARGRSSDFTAFPFFNLKGRDGGWIVAVGWSGQWAAQFAARGPGGVNVQAGMEKTHFRLNPGERVRTPRIVLLRWPGDEMIHGHNLFRRMMLRHYVPNHDRGAERSPVPVSLCDVGEMIIRRGWKRPTEKDQLALIKQGAELGFEAYWLDAYWFAGPGPHDDWIPHPENFPRGLRPLADAAHKAGMRFILWFEPERVYAGWELARKHPEFIHGGTNGGLWRLDNRDARAFLTDFLDQRIKQYGIDIYRQDFNTPATDSWRANDGADRQGVTEMLYIEGLYTLWSGLLKRNPGLVIDNCAGGGRRIDIESCSLTCQLYKSDWNDFREQSKGKDYWPRTSVAEQVMLSGLALYVPYRAGVLWDLRPYIFRSAMASGFVYIGNLESDESFRKLAQQAIAELKELRPLFLEDFYPLLNLTPRQEDWYAYQLDRPDKGEGCAFFFRRPQSQILICDITLYNIDLQATYDVSITGETYERGPWRKMSGAELMKPQIKIREKPGSVLLRYKRVEDQTTQRTRTP